MVRSVLDELRNAAAQGTLLVITGAGISRDLRRPDGKALPNWGQLVRELRDRADATKLSAFDRLLDELLPEKALDKVHGDALIEASEILQNGFLAGEFEQAIAEICREEDGTCTDTHRALAQIASAGVITFNYDRGHEQAFKEAGVDAESIRYDECDKLKARLASKGAGGPFVLKAHGCISHPPSLVLTSSSYHAILSKNRAYRLFLQHSLARYTVLVVGFALRDRDFDQLLGSLEIELGKPLQVHAFIGARPDAATTEGLVQRAHWAAVTARFGLHPLYVDDFTKLPDMLRSIGQVPGPLIEDLAKSCASPSGHTRAAAHDQAIGLGAIGRAQMRAALLARLDLPGLDLEVRSELIYAFRDIVDSDATVASRLVGEVQRAGDNATSAGAKLHAECAAHALVVLRGIRVRSLVDLRGTLSALKSPKLLSQLRELDVHADIPRLESYALAAAAEIESRNRACP